MSTFEKIIIPLSGVNFKSIDFTSLTGFIDTYTEDPDRPYYGRGLFVAFDDRVRNEYVEDLRRRIDTSTRILHKYIKYVNGVPYFIIFLYLDPDVKKYFNGVVSTSTSHKIQISQFWGSVDKTVDTVMSNQVLTLDVGHPVPLNDVLSDGFTDNMVIKKGQSLFRDYPFIF